MITKNVGSIIFLRHILHVTHYYSRYGPSWLASQWRLPGNANRMNHKCTYIIENIPLISFSGFRWFWARTAARKCSSGSTVHPTCRAGTQPDRSPRKISHLSIGLAPASCPPKWWPTETGIGSWCSRRTSRILHRTTSDVESCITFACSKGVFNSHPRGPFSDVMKYTSWRVIADDLCCFPHDVVSNFDKLCL